MVHSAAQMREELDEIHVDIGVLFPDHFLKIAVISQVDYASALARAYNAWLLEEWCSPENGLLGCINIALAAKPRGRGQRDESMPESRHGRGCSYLVQGSSVGGGTQVSTTRSTTPPKARTCPYSCTA